MDYFTSALGCRISLTPAPENLAPGRMLTLRMTQPGDGRFAEVYLSIEDQVTLRNMLNEGIAE